MLKYTMSKQVKKSIKQHWLMNDILPYQHEPEAEEETDEETWSEDFKAAVIEPLRLCNSNW